MRTARLTLSLVLPLTLVAPAAFAGAPAFTGDLLAATKATQPQKPVEPTPTTDDSDETPRPASSPTARAREETHAVVDSDAERPHTTYMYLGIRYGGDVIPSFLINAFVDHASTIYSNSFSAELDMRKDGYSFIPSLTYTDLSSGNMFIHQKGKDDTDWNWSMIHSSMKMLSVGLDMKWSVPIAQYTEYEYGVGFSLGAVFGNLQDDWVYTTAGPGRQSTDGSGLAPCATVDTSQAGGCNPGNHTNGNPAKVGGFTEKSWFNGGPKPSLIPNISLEVAGLRFRPVKELEARIGVGVALTGLWFSLSADYGLGESSKGQTTARR